MMGLIHVGGRLHRVCSISECYSPPNIKQIKFLLCPAVFARHSTWTFRKNKFTDGTFVPAFRQHKISELAPRPAASYRWGSLVHWPGVPSYSGGQKRLFGSSSCMKDNQRITEADETSLDDSNDDEILRTDLYTDEYFKPVQGHRVLVIHPELRSRHREANRELQAELQVAESCALVEALPGWQVVGKAVFLIRQVNSARVFTKGIFQEVAEKVKVCRNKSAVFINIGMLTAVQLSELQKAWMVPVYDRYTIILQIFRIRARTKEAKLQLALAEVPYYKSRLQGMHHGDLQDQRGGLGYVGGTGDTWIQNRYQILSERESTIRKKLAEIKKRRDFQRQERCKKDLPLVAVVGYTNAGKTSLIKALTQDASIEPWDQLFATLDVTCHGGYLGNRMRVVYIDTVGFISNIPTNLIESFKATLEDIANVDVIIHVRDVSHPDTIAQRETVQRTLASLNLDPLLLNSVLEINNKCDLIGRDQTESDENHFGGNDVPSRTFDSHNVPIYISTVTGEGLPELLQSLEGKLISRTDRLVKKLKIPTAGPHLRWLYREATVTSTRSCDTDPECLLIDAVMTKSAYAKFTSLFGKKKIAKGTR